MGERKTCIAGATMHEIRRIRRKRPGLAGPGRNGAIAWDSPALWRRETQSLSVVVNSTFSGRW